MHTREVFKVKGEKKESFLYGRYTEIEIEASTDELIEILKDPKIIVHEIKRKLITD